jgi:hypothetical protein
VKVECAYNELWPIERLKENPRNPNTHPQKQIDLLAKIIRETGWRSPIVVSARSGYVVKGHGRLLAARAAILRRDYQALGGFYRQEGGASGCVISRHWNCATTSGRFGGRSRIVRCKIKNPGWFNSSGERGAGAATQNRAEFETQENK